MGSDGVTRTAAKMPRDQREHLILDAAREDFGSLGYGGASIGSIASRAGVSKALILAYFGSKDALYAACADRAGKNLAAGIEKVITTEIDATEMAQQTLSAIFEALDGRQFDWHVLNDRTVPTGSVGHDVARRQRRTIAEQAGRGIASLGQFRSLDPEVLEIVAAVWMSAVTAVLDWWMRHPEKAVSDMMEYSRSVLGVLVQL